MRSYIPHRTPRHGKLHEPPLQGGTDFPAVRGQSIRSLAGPLGFLPPMDFLSRPVLLTAGAGLGLHVLANVLSSGRTARSLRLAGGGLFLTAGVLVLYEALRS